MTNTKGAFLLARLAIATSMFGHGLVRLFKLNGFSAWMVHNFQKSILPEALVIPFSYALPFAEFLTGLLLLIGLFTRTALIGGAIVMIILLFGTTMIENWEAIPTQLIHVTFFAGLLSQLQYNTFSMDNLIKKS
ncbi:MAG: DoxX family membrane protein [Puia sp.]|nr:DoxX family membrane protein [Puia sp.]